MSRRTLGAVIGVLLVTFGGVAVALMRDNDRTPRPTRTFSSPRATSEVISSGLCSNEETVAVDEARRSEGSLEGDVDGDGSDDQVFVALDLEGAPMECRAFLVIERSDGLWSLPIGNPATPYDLGYPRLNSLANVDGRSGLDVVVDVIAGASTQLAGVYTMDGGVLAQVRLKGGPALQDGLFPYGGSVGHLDAADCVPEEGPGTIVVSGALPAEAETTYEVVRRVYRYFRRAVLALDRAATETQLVPDPGSFAEYPASPFGNCPRL